MKMLFIGLEAGGIKLFNHLLSNALVGGNHVLTKITLSVFEDSGW
jgi:hypothetical protein